MSQAEVERFLGRLITDGDFRARASASLNDICYDEGIGLTPNEMACLSRIDFIEFAAFSDAIDDSIRRT